MLLVINHRYPRAGAVLSLLSSLAFIAVGIRDHSMLMIVSSAVFLALPLVKTAYKRQHGTPQTRS
jgi:hypothetical protein